MAFADDLLDQAGHLAQMDPRRPKQASLKRAVSTAYYSLFHLLVSAAASNVSNDRRVRARASRALKHTEMQSVCLQFAKKPNPINSALLDLPLDPDLKRVAAAFVELQQARHSADYDPDFEITRTDASRLISSARDAFSKWKTIRSHRNAKVFLAALLLGERWNKL